MRVTVRCLGAQTRWASWYAPLEPKESLYLEYEGEGRYKFVYYLKTQDGKPTPLFQITMSLSMGGVGMVKEEVTFVGPPLLSREAALAVMRVFLVPEDMGTPPGAIAMRGATNFQTPKGWDTIYTPIFNNIERPVAPMLVVRVETDWYAHETEFRYVLQAGEGITVEPAIPIGQVLFVRVKTNLLDGNARYEGVRGREAGFAKHKAKPCRPRRTGFHTVRTTCEKPRSEVIASA
jgi:hypothetical protein